MVRTKQTKSTFKLFITLFFTLLFTTLPVAFAVSVNPSSITVVVTDTTATISWTTDTASTGVVNYGQSISSLQAGASTSGTSTSHSVSLMNLDDYNYYYYNIQATDSVGTYTTTYMNFTTLLAAPQNLQATAIEENTITLHWSDSDGARTYNVYKDNVLLTAASGNEYEATGLGYKTTYSFFVKAVDQYGRESAASNTVTVTTQEQPVEITFVQATSVTKTTAIIHWITDRATNGTIWYGTSEGNLNQTITQSDQTTEHEVVLKDLKEETTYYYKIGAAETVSAETYYFKTSGDETPIEILNIEVKDITRSTAEISWTTNVESRGYIYYSTDDSFTQSVREDIDAISHSEELTDLLSGMTYYFKIVADETESQISSFTTSESLYDFLDLEEVPSLVSSTTLLLKGSTAENGKVYIFVNKETNPYAQVMMDVVGTQFEANVTLNAYAYVDGVRGRNIIEINSWDQDNNKAVKTYTVDVDTGVPLLSVNEIPTYISTSKVNISGITEVGTTVGFFVDEKSKGSMYVTEETGYFEYMVDVGSSSTNHTIAVQAADAAGNIATYEKMIIVDHEQPKLTFYTSFSGQTHYKLFRIDGNTEPGAMITVTNFGEFSGCGPEFETKYGECDYLANVYGPGPYQSLEALIDPTSLMVELLSLTVGVPTSTVAGPDGNFSVIVSLFPGEADTQMLGKNTLLFNVTDQAGNKYDLKKEIRYQPSCVDWVFGKTTSFPTNIYTSDMSAGDIMGSALFELDYVGGGVPVLGKVTVKEDDSAGKLLSQKTTELGTTESLYYAQTYGGLENSNEYITISSQSTKVSSYDPESRRMYIYVPVTINRYKDNVDKLPEQFGVYLDTYLTYTDGNGNAANCHLYPAVSYDVQKPESFTKWLSPTMINQTITALDQTINVTESAVKYLGIAARWTTVACGATIAWNYVQGFSGGSYVEGSDGKSCNTNLKSIYAVCDRILCPAIPPNCKEMKPTGVYTWDNGHQQCGVEGGKADNSACINEYNKVKVNNDNVENDYKQKYEDYKKENGEMSFSKYYDEVTKGTSEDGKNLKATGYDSSLSQPYTWQTKDPETGELVTIQYLDLDERFGDSSIQKVYDEQVADCGPGTEALIRVTGLSESESTKLNLAGFGESVHTVQGTQYACSKEAKHEIGAPPEDLIPGCYSEECPYYDQTKCLVGKGHNMNPAADLFGSLQCGCITGAKAHLENLLKILYGAKKCLQQALIGETTAGYCERLMSYFVCDILTQIFKHIFTSLGQGSAFYEGIFGREGLENYQENAESINKGLKDRYGDIVNDRMGLSTDNIVNKACLAAFTADWSVLESALDKVVDSVEVAPMMNTEATSRIYGYDPFTGKMSIAYNLYLGVVPGGETQVEAWLECDEGGPDGEYCAKSVPDKIDLVSKGLVDPRLTQDDFVDENFIYIDQNSASWYNEFHVRLTYKIGGEWVEPDEKVVQIIKKSDLNMLDCNFDPTNGFDCSIGAQFADLSNGVGGTVQLYSASQGTTLSPKVTSYYPGNQIAALVKVNNGYPDDFYLRVDSPNKEFEYTAEGGTETGDYRGLQWYLLWLDGSEQSSSASLYLEDWGKELKLEHLGDDTFTVPLSFSLPDEITSITLKLYPYEDAETALAPVTCVLDKAVGKTISGTDGVTYYICIDEDTSLTDKSGVITKTYNDIESIKAIKFSKIGGTLKSGEIYKFNIDGALVQETGNRYLEVKYSSSSSSSSPTQTTTINVLSDVNEDGRGESLIYSSDQNPKDQKVTLTYGMNSAASGTTNVRPVIHFIEPTSIIEEQTGYVNSDGNDVPIGFTVWDDKEDINSIAIGILGFNNYQCEAKWEYIEGEVTFDKMLVPYAATDGKENMCGLTPTSRTTGFVDEKPSFFEFDLIVDGEHILVDDDAFYDISIFVEDADQNQAEPQTRRIKFSTNVEYDYNDMLVCLGSGACASTFDSLATEINTNIESVMSSSSTS